MIHLSVNYIRDLAKTNLYLCSDKPGSYKNLVKLILQASAKYHIGTLTGIIASADSLLQ
jgi:hypothetical protein